ncbi:SPOR domain-containing protein [Barnesiella propionica]|uniref:SPOR domain-containing protein n=1 Tax=Barnesiella propionica TaxID=2981781 RepID=UPI0014322509|nr:SPOR domain-containing protein [Barnesiella propionica]MCU6768056.1 SPOR domain-containing protein [Barnesiella propionica]
MMRRHLYLFVCFSFFFSSYLYAETAVSDTSIVQYLERSETGGIVKIYQPKELAGRVSRSTEDRTIIEAGKTNYVQRNGYRIQVFSDNQRHAKTEAQNKQQQIRNKFPEMGTYIIYNSPFFRLRVGDFRSYEEANRALQDLKNAFPQFAREMRVVRDKINVPL